MIATMRWRLFADAVVLSHAAYVAFVIFGFIAIVVGAALEARWVRNFWFRVFHLAAIALVLAEALLGMICPLTWLENILRVRAGQAGYPADFIGYWVHRFIFFAWRPWVFVALYAGFALLVAAAFWLAPPEPPRWQRK